MSGKDVLESDIENESESESFSDSDSESDESSLYESSVDGDDDLFIAKEKEDGFVKIPKTKNKDKDKKKKMGKILKKLIKKDKLPPLKNLQKIALQNDISTKDAIGHLLTKEQLYEKLSSRYPELLKPKARENLKTVRKYYLTGDQTDKLAKLEKKDKEKLSENDKKKLDFLIGVLAKMEKQEETDQKLNLRKDFIKKEKKLYDDMFSLSLLDNDDIYDYKDDPSLPIVTLLVLKVKKEYLQKALRKYVHYKDVKEHYSMLILYRVMRSMKPDELNELITDAEIQAQIDRLQEIEHSFMTTKELEKIKELIDSVVPKENTSKKIELFE